VTMQIKIREVVRDDFPEILRLNKQALPQVSPVDLDKLDWFTRVAPYFRVADVNDKVAGFLIAIAEDCAYPSQYFQWFCERYDRFIYIDRIIVADWARKNRIAWRLYEDVEQFALDNAYPLTADVYCQPPNEISLTFHEKYGFKVVGTQPVENGTKAVTKFLK
jgi:predicted GNAT superfamily acetyltransferase